MGKFAAVNARVAELEHDLKLCERRVKDLKAELGTALDTQLANPLTDELVPVPSEGGVQQKRAGAGVQVAKKAAKQ